MKKIPLLLSTLGGAMAGYLFTNDKLRKDLVSAKDPEEAAKLLGKHLQKDSKQFAKQVREFVESEEVQNNFAKAKKFAKQKAAEAQKEINAMVAVGKKKATSVVKRGGAQAKKTAKKASKSVKANAKKAS